MATKHFGLTVSDAYVSDSKVIRFSVLSHAPLTVQLYGSGR